jgi:hypothetical protein
LDIVKEKKRKLTFSFTDIIGKVRQITVPSINKEHRVWINVDPTETGLSLADKIHIIATFRTRKILSITTASGRQIPLDHRPIFGSWVDMEKFVDGEPWKVEWGDLDKGVMDKFFSKMVSVSTYSGSFFFRYTYNCSPNLCLYVGKP